MAGITWRATSAGSAAKGGSGRPAVEAVRKGLEDLDHRQGYRGPVRNVAATAIANEVRADEVRVEG